MAAEADPGRQAVAAVQVDRQRDFSGEPPQFDPLEKGFFDDPYPQYELLRERNPVFRDDRGIVFCFAYDDVRKVLIDPRRTSMDRKRALAGRAGTGTREAPTFPLSVINRDPPDHTRLRRLLSPTFTARNVDMLTAAMQSHLDDLFAELDVRHHENDEPVDLVAGLTFPFPFRVISTILGMPDGSDSLIRSWAHDISLASDPMVDRDCVARAITAYRAISEYVAEEVLPWKRANKRVDLLSDLLAAEEDGSLSTAELVDNVALLYVAGHETTSGLIGNSILNLLRYPMQFETLRAAPALLPNAIEELNRFESSVQFAWRYVVDDLRVRDFVIPSGTMTFVCCGSANRDPDHFGQDAGELNLSRAAANDALSFGAGMHYCLGAHLARREAALVIEKLFDRFPTTELAGEPRWGHRATFRSLEYLPVRLG